MSLTLMRKHLLWVAVGAIAILVALSVAAPQAKAANGAVCTFQQSWGMTDLNTAVTNDGTAGCSGDPVLIECQAINDPGQTGPENSGVDECTSSAITWPVEPGEVVGLNFGASYTLTAPGDFWASTTGPCFISSPTTATCYNHVDYVVPPPSTPGVNGPAATNHASSASLTVKHSH